MKLIEKILANREYCEKIAEMSLEEFKTALAERGADVKNAEKVYSAAKTAVAGGELDDEDLSLVAGGACSMCECAPGYSAC